MTLKEMHDIRRLNRRLHGMLNTLEERIDICAVSFKAVASSEPHAATRGYQMHNQFGRTAIFGASALAIALIATSAAAADYKVELSAATEQGVPADYTSEQWLEARGEARAVVDGDQHEITFEASGLVPEGLYTFWWVSSGLLGMSMGPGGGVPDNEFATDAEGHAATTIRVPSDNDYQMMVVVYHADGQAHGDSPGEMGTVSFEHLRGAWPGPAGEMTN